MMIDNELLLEDRLAIIKDIDKSYDLQNNSYLSLSGGRDSLVLSYLLDLALPNNKIPRVFINTGIEYNAILEFVKELSQKDNRIVIIEPSQPIIPMLKKYRRINYRLRSEQNDKIH